MEHFVKGVLETWPAQLVGIVGATIFAVSFLRNVRANILLLVLSGQLLFVCHFWLIGARTGSAIAGVGALRTVLFILKEKHGWARSRRWPYAFSILFVIAGLVTWQGLISILPPACMLLETVATWQDKPRNIRRWMLSAQLLWIPYDILAGSLGGLFGASLTSIFILVGMGRYDQEP